MRGRDDSRMPRYGVRALIEAESILPGLPGGRPYIPAATMRDAWVGAIKSITPGDMARVEQARRLGLPAE